MSDSVVIDPPEDEDRWLREMLNADERQALDRADSIASWFDDRFTLPGTGFRFGFDGIIGLIPGVGDTVTGLLGLYFLQLAMRLKLGVGTQVRIVLNIIIDSIVGAIPLLGDLFDFGFKAHRKNNDLIRRKLHERARRNHEGVR